MRFTFFFHSICLNYCACHEKVTPGHTKCCTCHTNSSYQTWRSDAPKFNPSQEIRARTSQPLWWTCLLCCACHATCLFADPLQMSHSCQCFWNCYKNLTFCWLLTLCTIPCAATRNDIGTSKSGPTMICYLTFWLPNVLRATTACNFSSLIWPDGSAPAALASLLFDPPEPQIIGKTQCFAAVLPFCAPGSSFFWDFIFLILFLLLFSSLLSCLLWLLPPLLFHLPILSEVWLLNFLRLQDMIIAKYTIMAKYHDMLLHIKI